MVKATSDLSRRCLISSTAALAGGTAINAVAIAAAKAGTDVGSFSCVIVVELLEPPGAMRFGEAGCVLRTRGG